MSLKTIIIRFSYKSARTISTGRFLGVYMVYSQNWEIHMPVHLPYLYLEVARIPPSSQDYSFRSLRNDKRSKENELSSKPLSPGRAREIPKEKLEAIGLNLSGFSNHS